MQNTADSSENMIISTKTDIHGLPASYVFAKDPSDPSGQTCIVVKVLDVPLQENEPSSPTSIRVPHSYLIHNFSETPVHLCDPTKLITQHRCGNHALPHRVIDISKQTHTLDEMKWYADPESKIPKPFHLVFVPKLKCYLCGDFQETDEDIHYEGVGQHTFGYRFCTECKPYFMKSMYKAIAPILQFRRNYEEWMNSNDSTTPRTFIWVARTRRDENGIRIVHGNTPYKYTKWNVLCWVAEKVELPRICPEDGETIINVKEDSLLCEQVEGKEVVGFECMSISKSVSLRDIYITNLGLLGENADPEYDPNNDDPLNKYSEKEQCEMFERASTLACI
jgi:hypothetical protein